MFFSNKKKGDLPEAKADLKRKAISMAEKAGLGAIALIIIALFCVGFVACTIIAFGFFAF